jgi:F0F1-type ATP synthase delta subunit
MQTIINNYAEALLELVGHDDIIKIKKEIINIVHILPDILSANIFVKYKIVIWRRILEIFDEQKIIFHNITTTFLTYLIQRNDLNYIEDIILVLDKLLDMYNNVNRFDIIVPSIISADTKKNILIMLEEFIIGKIMIKVIVDKTIFSGIIIKFQNKILDISGRGALNIIRKKLYKIT